MGGRRFINPRFIKQTIIARYFFQIASRTFHWKMVAAPVFVFFKTCSKHYALSVLTFLGTRLLDGLVGKRRTGKRRMI